MTRITPIDLPKVIGSYLNYSPIVTSSSSLRLKTSFSVIPNDYLTYTPHSLSFYSSYLGSRKPDTSTPLSQRHMSILLSFLLFLKPIIRTIQIL